VRDALRTQGDEVILKELKQMVDRKVFHPVHRTILILRNKGYRTIRSVALRNEWIWRKPN
jgi:hypothetical protein